MATSRIEEKIFGIKKEAVRGTAEASASSARYLPLLPGSEVNFIPALLEDGKIYGDPQERQAQPGVRDGSGTLELEPGADKLGELLNSLFGAVATDQPDFGGAPLVFRHRFTPADDPLHPLYTLFVDRKTTQKKYEGLSANQMTFNVPVDGRIAVSADVMHKSEQAGAVLTPDFSADLDHLLFSDVKMFVAGAQSSIVRAGSVVLNNGSVRKRVLAQSRDAADIVAGPFRASGTFQMYFEDEVERAKFIATTSSSLKVLAEGQILQAAQKATLELDMPLTKYDAGPIAEVDGILVQDFSFKAYRDPTAGYSCRATLINKETAY